MARICPDCKIELTRRDFDGLVLDTCSKCAGVYFDEGELTELRRRGEQALTALDEQVQPSELQHERHEECLRVCPGCGNGMHQFRYLYSSPVLLDSCEDCGGVWIDNGELKAMQEYLQLELGSQRVAREVAAGPQNDRARIAARAARYLALRKN
jgi:Zn-finger nucleic acid-binding protein